MSVVTKPISAREAYAALGEVEGPSEENVKKKESTTFKKPNKQPSQMPGPSGMSDTNGVLKNGKAKSDTKVIASGKRKCNTDLPSPPSKIIKKVRQKKANINKSSVPCLTTKLSEETPETQMYPPGQSSDDQNANESESDEEEMTEGYGTLKVDCVSGEAIDAASVSDSLGEGQNTFQWMINPQSESEFFSDYWEKQPLYLKRNNPDYYKNVFSTAVMDRILHEEKIQYSKNLDVTSYSDGKRQTHNLVGQAHASVVWDYYTNGCSLRLLNPQTFHRPAWKLLYNLQEYFSSFCGANVYLTPPGTQGFAPHWDDIEAFLLQLEGKKHWKVYKPRSEEEELPEVSSPNFNQEDIGEPILEVTLEAGDLLYFPRGFIHQAQTDEDDHSLHITVSTYQKNSWGRYLQKLLPRALELAMAEDVEFRRGLPLDHLRVMGVVNSDVETPGRSAFLSKVKELMERLLLYAPFDAAADQFGANLMHDALPPLLTPEEKLCSVYKGGERWCRKKKKVINRVELNPDTYIRLIRGNCLRVVSEEECVRIYHCLENTREYHQEEPQFFEMSAEHAPAVEALIHNYPKYTAVENLPVDGDIEKMAVARGLWERGMLMTAQPLENHYDD